MACSGGDGQPEQHGVGGSEDDPLLRVVVAERRDRHSGSAGDGRRLCNRRLRFGGPHIEASNHCGRGELVAAAPTGRIAGDGGDGGCEHRHHEDGHDQAADRAERGPRVPTDPVHGDDTSRAPDRTGHEVGHPEGQHRAGGHQPERDQQKAHDEKHFQAGNVSRTATRA